jgi:alkanesulfonate monooxygenase SsuD/methylene tetrahydromethanopterin reductase-like flavin-dependent oxidoreductase (luciferase family)
MQLGVTLPVADIGTDPTVVRDYAQAAEGLGYSHLLVGDHVLGANPAADRGVFVSSAADMASRHDDYRRVGSTLYAFLIRSCCLASLPGTRRRSALPSAS